MLQKVYYFENIGEIAFQKKSNSTNIRITIKPNQGIKVTLPNHVSLSKAFRFVEEKSDWIIKSLESIKSIERKQTLFLPDIEYWTNYHRLEFVKNNELLMRVRISKGLIKVFYNNDKQVSSEAGQQLIRKGIINALKIEANILLPSRLSYLASYHGLQFGEVKVKNLKSRWGSCSSSNNINLNIHLVRLPRHLMDYVILHELAHTVHKNHGKQFWQFLEKLSGNARGLAREMKEYRTQAF